MQFLSRGAWDGQMFAAETLACSEGAETEGCLLRTLLAHGAIGTFIGGESSRCMIVITTANVMSVAFNSILLRSEIVGHVS